MKTLPFKDAICSAVIIFIQTSLRLKKTWDSICINLEKKQNNLLSWLAWFLE